MGVYFIIIILITEIRRGLRLGNGLHVVAIGEFRNGIGKEKKPG
jgi:hypothetical protein